MSTNEVKLQDFHHTILFSSHSFCFTAAYLSLYLFLCLSQSVVCWKENLGAADVSKMIESARLESKFSKTGSEEAILEKTGSDLEPGMKQLHTAAFKSALESNDFAYSLCMLGYKKELFGRKEGHDPNNDQFANNMAECCAALGLDTKCGRNVV